MKIEETISLAPHTTFKLGGNARFFCTVSNEDELIQAVQYAHEKKLPVFVLGGGSNVLIGEKGFEGLVIKMEIKGIAESGSDIVRVGAGESWDDFVKYTVDNGFHGLENLSTIPGTVGAAPVQNIGAYGTEVKNTISSVRALDTKAMTFVDLSNEDCHFSYRDSMFKREKGRYIITRVDFKLSREGQVNISYKDLQEYFKQGTRYKVQGENPPSLLEIRKAVIQIRGGKFPDLSRNGTAGSFFKNPIISSERFNELKQKYRDLPGYPEADGRVKVSLAWIIDKACNAKGLNVGKARTFEKQALVLVTEPGASAADVNVLAEMIVASVKEKTGIDIEREVERLS